MTTLPKDVEEAIEAHAKICWDSGCSFAFKDSPDYAAIRKEATDSLKRIMQRELNKATVQPTTQRQRYKEAALTGMMADPSRNGVMALYVKEAACFADLFLAEDAEHAKKEKQL